MQNDSERTFNVFFYGLNMDADMLSAKGVTPREMGVAFVDDHVVRLGAKAMLLRSRGGRAYGMLFRLTHREMDTLYADAHDYRPEAFLATPLNGEKNTQPRAAISMVHRDPPSDSPQNPEYRVRWQSLMRRLGIPPDASIEMVTGAR